MEKAEEAFEAAYLDKPKAETNKLQAEAASALITSLKDTEHACIQVGSLLLVKSLNNCGKASIVTRTLTRVELKRLEENQAMLQRPGEILSWLCNDHLKPSDRMVKVNPTSKPLKNEDNPDDIGQE